MTTPSGDCGGARGAGPRSASVHGSGADVDAILELLDLSVGRVEGCEVRVGHVVDEPVDERPGRRTVLCGWVEANRIERRSARRSLSHRDEELGRGNEIDLLVDDLIRIWARLGGQEHAEDVGTVSFEQGPWRASVAWTCRESLDNLRVDVNRQRREQILCGRIDEVEPACAHRRRA